MAIELPFRDDFVTSFDILYRNIHAVNIPRQIGRNSFNAFTGIFHDGSLREYYRMGTKIERIARDHGLPTVSKSSDALDDLSNVLEDRYGKFWVAK